MEPDPYARVLRFPVTGALHNGAPRVGLPADAVPTTAPVYEVAPHGSRNRTCGAQPDCHYGTERHATHSLGTGPRGTASTGSFSMTPDLGSESCCVLPRSPSTACRARSTADPPTDGGDAWGRAHSDASQERPTTPPSHGGPVAIEAIQGILQDEHEDQHTFLDGQWSAADHFLDPLPLLGTDLDNARVRNDASIVESRHDNMAGQRRVADARQVEVWRGRRRAATRPPRPMHTTPGGVAPISGKPLFLH